MRAERSQDDIPPWALQAVEQASQSKLLQVLGIPFVRANSSSYVQLAWTTAHLPALQEQRAVSRSVITAGDPSVAPWRKWASLWQNTRILMADWNTIDALTSEAEDPQARQVAGYLTADREIHIGVLPKDKQFGTLPGESGIATIAYRQGSSASRLIMGVLRGNGELVVPEGLQVLQDSKGEQFLLPVVDLAVAYPETPLV